MGVSESLCWPLRGGRAAGAQKVWGAGGGPGSNGTAGKKCVETGYLRPDLQGAWGLGRAGGGNPGEIRLAVVGVPALCWGNQKDRGR